MQKKFYLLIISLLLFIPLKVKADYEIKHYYIESFIQANGNLLVKEAIYIAGDINGYEKDIYYLSNKGSSIYNASDLIDMVIKGKKVSKASFNIFNDSLTTFKETNYANNGDSYKYLKSSLNGGYRYRMYQPTNGEMVVFYLEYTLKDVAIKHEDVAEVRWNFIGDGYEDDINDLQIKLYLPDKDDSQDFRIFANADNNLIGKVEKINNEGLYAYTDKLDSYSPLTLRVTFAKDLLNSDVQKVSNAPALEEILKEEQINADRQNALRKEIRFRYYSTIVLSSIYIISVIIAFLYTYFKYDKERKSNFKGKYYREFIDDYNVEVIDYLMKKNITPNALSASIMNLIYKKNITFKDLDGNNKEYEFTLENDNNTNETEKILLNFLFQKVGKDNKFTTKELKDYAKSTKTCNTFMNSYTKWKNAVIADGEKQEFFEKKKSSLGVVLFIVGLIITFYNYFLNVLNIVTILPLLLSIGYFVYSLLYTKKTEKGIEHYAKWQAFKNFLDDFSTFELKELPEIILWERYLVYATIFGLAEKVKKVMNVKIKEIDTSTYYGYNPVFIYNNINIGNVINNTVTSAINGATVAINRANASSSFSSGSGFGGGFSSGGGFGGGGGGGRGF